jgi:hypothetical protein
MLQPFDRDGKLLCAACMRPIARFYLVVREHDPIDADAQLAVHADCLSVLCS